MLVLLAAFVDRAHVQAPGTLPHTPAFQVELKSSSFRDRRSTSSLLPCPWLREPPEGMTVDTPDTECRTPSTLTTLTLGHCCLAVTQMKGGCHKAPVPVRARILPERPLRGGGERGTN